jgi:hypothetical protein
MIPETRTAEMFMEMKNVNLTCNLVKIALFDVERPRLLGICIAIIIRRVTPARPAFGDTFMVGSARAQSQPRDEQGRDDHEQRAAIGNPEDPQHQYGLGAAATACLPFSSSGSRIAGHGRDPGS